MKIVDDLQLQFRTAEDASIFLQSFLPEAHSMPMKRSQWVFSEPTENHLVSVHIEALDLIAFRATINSLVQMAYVVEKTITIINSSL